jgi:hypothetical protein
MALSNEELRRLSADVRDAYTASKKAADAVPDKGPVFSYVLTLRIRRSPRVTVALRASGVEFSEAKEGGYALSYYRPSSQGDPRGASAKAMREHLSAAGWPIRFRQYDD